MLKYRITRCTCCAFEPTPELLYLGGYSSELESILATDFKDDDRPFPSYEYNESSGYFDFKCIPEYGSNDYYLSGIYSQFTINAYMYQAEYPLLSILPTTTEITSSHVSNPPDTMAIPSNLSDRIDNLILNQEAYWSTITSTNIKVSSAYLIILEYYPYSDEAVNISSYYPKAQIIREGIYPIDYRSGICNFNLYRTTGIYLIAITTPYYKEDGSLSLINPCTNSALNTPWDNGFKQPVEVLPLQSYTSSAYNILCNYSGNPGSFITVIYYYDPTIANTAGNSYFNFMRLYNIGSDGSLIGSDFTDPDTLSGTLYIHAVEGVPHLEFIKSFPGNASNINNYPIRLVDSISYTGNNIVYSWQAYNQNTLYMNQWLCTYNGEIEIEEYPDDWIKSIENIDSIQWFLKMNNYPYCILLDKNTILNLATPPDGIDTSICSVGAPSFTYISSSNNRSKYAISGHLTIKYNCNTANSYPDGIPEWLEAILQAWLIQSNFVCTYKGGSYYGVNSNYP